MDLASIKARENELEQMLREAKDYDPSLGLEILPGCEYSRVAIPLDYKPSRNLTPRYGSTHERIIILDQWFKEYKDYYSDFIHYMRSLNVGQIATQKSDTGSKPSWFGGPIQPFDSMVLYAMIIRYKPNIFFLKLAPA